MKNAVASKPIRQQKSEALGDKFSINSQAETQKSLVLISSPAKAIHIQVQHDLEIQNKQKNSHIHIHNSIKPWKNPTTGKYPQTANPTKRAHIFKTQKTIHPHKEEDKSENRTPKCTWSVKYNRIKEVQIAKKKRF
jgi:hypothetical protein